MEDRLAAEKLYAHIISRYGNTTAFNFKVLCSLRSFRHLVTIGVIPKKMLSFENVLAKQHATTLRRDRFATDGFVNFCQGLDVFNVRDDRFGTVTGAIQDRLVETYMGFAHLAKTPIVQMGGGISVPDVIDDFDRGAFEEQLLPILAANAKYADAVANYNKHAAMVTEVAPKNSVAYMLLFESVHQLFRQLRKDDLAWLISEADKAGMQRQNLPLAEGEDVAKLMNGEKAASYHLKGGIKDSMVKILEAVYEDQGVVFTLSKDKRTLTASVHNPFAFIGSELVALPAISYTDADVPADAPADALSPASSTSTIEEVDDMEALKTAKSLMLKYLTKDLNSLSPREKIEAQYGSERGEAIAEKVKKNEKFKKKFNIRFKVGEPIEWGHWLRSVAELLAENFNITHDVALPLAQGMAYCRANKYKFRLTDSPPTITRTS